MVEVRYRTAALRSVFMRKARQFRLARFFSFSFKNNAVGFTALVFHKTDPPALLYIRGSTLSRSLEEPVLFGRV